MPISRTLRFEVLRRDKFTCTYCGAHPPDTTLTIDHVVPVALGGADTPENLRTACAECNGGKGATPPEAALVADVAADAERWAHAITRAAAEMEAADSAADWFPDMWHENTPGCYLPADASQRIVRYINRGLPRRTVEEMYWVAVAAQHISSDRMWAYFQGCLNNRLDQLIARARQIIDEEP